MCSVIYMTASRRECSPPRTSYRLYNSPEWKLRSGCSIYMYGSAGSFWLMVSGSSIVGWLSAILTYRHTLAANGKRRETHNNSVLGTSLPSSSLPRQQKASSSSSLPFPGEFGGMNLEYYINSYIRDITLYTNISHPM